MAGLVEVGSTADEVEPGKRTVLPLTVYNTGATRMSFRLEVVGEVAPWARLEPPSVDLDAGASATVDMVMHPPVSSEVPAGPNRFAVHLLPGDGGPAEVAEASVDVAPVEAFAARILPELTETALRAFPRLEVRNDGNVALVVAVVASDADGYLAAVSEEPTLLVPAGTTESCRISVRTKDRRLFGRAPVRRYRVTLTTMGDTVKVLEARIRPKGTFAAYALRIGAIVVVAGAAGAGISYVANRPDTTVAAGGTVDGKTRKGLPNRIGGAAVTTVQPSGAAEAAPAVVTIAGVTTVPPTTVPGATTVATTPPTTALIPPAPETKGPVKILPLRRLYDSAVNDYVYTTNDEEAAQLVSQGVLDQGTVGKVHTTRQPGTVALYRLVGPDGRHLFTIDEAERTQALQKGFKDQGLGGYVFPNPVQGTIAIFRLTKDGQVFLTTSATEVQQRTATGWANEGVRGYLLA